MLGCEAGSIANNAALRGAVGGFEKVFEVNRNFEAHKSEASTPIVGNISHVYLFHVDRAPDSVPDSIPDSD